MEKIAVIYSSKFGHTKKYADWLKEDLGADVLSVDGFSPTKLLSYKLVIFACGVYGDKLSIIDFIKKNMSSVPLQKSMIMAVSWYTNDSEEAKQKLIEENYPEQLKNVVPMYVVNSGIDLKKVPPMDKAKLLTARLMIEKKEGRSSDDINALAIIKGYSDQTSKDNLAGIKKAIDEFFNPPKKEEAPAKPAAKSEPKAAPKAEPKPKAAPAASDDLSQSVDDAFKNLGAPKPKAEPAAESAPKAEPKPKAAPAASDDLSQSVDDAFKNLGAPKPKPAPKTESAPKAEPKPKAAPAASDDLSQSVDDAFKNLGAPKPKPKPKAAPEASEVPSGEPVVRFNSSGQVVVSSVMNAINSLNHTQEAHSSEATFEDVPPVGYPAAAFQSAIPEPDPEPVVQEAAPAPKPEVQPAVTEAVSQQPQEETPAQRKNSYMELFANRRRKAATEEAVSTEAAHSAAEPAPAAPVQEAPAPQPAEPSPVSPAPAASAASISLDSFDIAEAALNLHTSAPQTRAAVPAPSIEIDEMDSYDFIGEESASASKRALNAVQDLAKAKAAAEKEAAKKSSAFNMEQLAAAAAEAEQAASDEEEVYTTDSVSEETANALEKMKHDIAALAEESEHNISYEDSEQEEFTMPADNEAEEDGLSAFDFADTADYYASEPVVEIEPEPEAPASREKTDLDLRKLQEEINASIETNRVTRERMQAKYGKKAKEAVVNPFAVQFDEEEDDKKKGKKKKAEPKRLADPIDPDIFFNKPGKDYFTASDTMPELKIRGK